MRALIVLLALLGLSAFPARSRADQICEDFPDPLGGWKSRWMGQHTDMENYYVCSDSTSDENFRGSNCCGLWICDADHDFSTVIIHIDPSLGAGVRQLSIGIMSFVPAVYTVLDLEGTQVFTADIAGHGTFPPCDGNRIVTETPGGLGQIRIAAGGAGRVEGNVSVYNVCVTLATPTIDRKR